MHLIIKYLIYMLRQIRLVLHLHFDRFVFSSSCHVFFFQVPIFHSKKKKENLCYFLSINCLKLVECIIRNSSLPLLGVKWRVKTKRNTLFLKISIALMALRIKKKLFHHIFVVTLHNFSKSQIVVWRVKKDS